MSAAAEVQRRLWGTDPRAWAELAEAHNRPLFEAVLDAARVGDGTRVLDVGCGSGLDARAGARARRDRQRASTSARGCSASRASGCPDADLREGDMETLPFADDGVRRGARRQRVPVRGRPACARCARRRGCAAGRASWRACSPRPSARRAPSLHEAMSALIPPEQAGDHAPYALSAPGNLEAALRAAGPDRRRRRRGRVHLALPRRWTTRCARCCARRAARAAKEAAGEGACAPRSTEALRPFERGGGVRLRNTFRWVAATR